MEESGEGQSDDNKLSQDNKKRRLKTPSQVMALEKFYDEHKYPTEEMKAELAGKLGLTEKQISGWFCHRRLKDKRSLKDEKCPSGARQERLSGVVQDLGSGLGQDSCGSTKHVDYRHIDPREVESRMLYGQDFQPSDLNHENRTHHMERVSHMDDTSSESSSSLQDRLVSQPEDLHGVETSRYLIHDGLVAPLNSKDTRHVGYKPSGYLKVKGEIENAAITAVKRQLGRQYHEDGPLLGVDFDPLPPGAFESPPRDPIHEPYYIGNPVRSHSPDIAAMKRQPSPVTRYEGYSSKLSSRDLYSQEGPGILHGVSLQETKSNSHLRQKSTYFDHPSSVSGRNSSLDIYDDSSYKSKKSRKMGLHAIEAMASDSFVNHHGHSGGKVSMNQTVPWLNNNNDDGDDDDDDENDDDDDDNDDDISPKIVQRSGYPKFKPSITQRYCETPDVDEERRISVIMTQGNKFSGEVKATKDVKVKMKPVSEMAVGKRVRVDFPLQENGANPSFAERLPRQNHIKGSALEMPSSFSEDETAETSCSAE